MAHAQDFVDVTTPALGGSFSDVSSGPFAADTFSKGLACGYYDGDGDLDLFFVNIGPNQLVRNDAPDSNGNHFLQIDLEAITGNRRGSGSRITVVTPGRHQIREVSAGSGYLSHHSVIVRWPEGTTQVLSAIDADQRMTIVEGTGPTAAAPVVQRLRVDPVRPNPFNPRAVIRFELSRRAVASGTYHVVVRTATEQSVQDVTLVR